MTISDAEHKQRGLACAAQGRSIRKGMPHAAKRDTVPAFEEWIESREGILC